MADANAGDISKLADFAPLLAAVKEARKTKTRSEPWPPAVQRGVANFLKRHTKDRNRQAILHALGLDESTYGWPILREMLGLSPKQWVDGKFRTTKKKGRKRDYKAERRRAKAKRLALKPVQISAGRPSLNGAAESLVLHTPDGYQIEGSLESVAALLNQLKGAH